MLSTNFIPSRNADFVIWLGNFVTKLTTVYNGTFAARVAVFAPPAPPFLPNVELRMRLLIKQIKANTNYSLAVGTFLALIVIVLHLYGYDFRYSHSAQRNFIDEPLELFPSPCRTEVGRTSPHWLFAATCCTRTNTG